MKLWSFNSKNKSCMTVEFLKSSRYLKTCDDFEWPSLDLRKRVKQIHVSSGKTLPTSPTVASTVDMKMHIFGASEVGIQGQCHHPKWQKHLGIPILIHFHLLMPHPWWSLSSTVYLQHFSSTPYSWKALRKFVFVLITECIPSNAAARTSNVCKPLTHRQANPVNISLEW